ncbi:MAG: hypothetical protein CMP23_14090 [Rickettsiales bacterium]|nr:hypothetical protein [Rickettsiales bacterium]
MNLDLVCDDELRLSNFSWSQELLGSIAAQSRLSMVVPVDVGAHFEGLQTRKNETSVLAVLNMTAAGLEQRVCQRCQSSTGA